MIRLEWSSFRDYYIIFSLIALSILTNIFFGVKHYEMEQGAYGLYAKSMVTDGDFNTINQETGDFVFLTKNNNSIDYHSPFFSSLLIPFEGLRKKINDFIPEVFPLESYYSSYLFLNLTTLVIFLGLFLIHLKNNLLVTSAILLGTPLLWSLLILPGDPSVFIMFLHFPIVYFLANQSKGKDQDKWNQSIFLFCVFTSSLLKPDFTIWFPLIIIFLIIKKEYKLMSKFFLSYILAVTMKHTTIFIRLGEILPVNPIPDFTKSFHFSILFGPSGLFKFVPIIPLSLLLLLKRAFLNKKLDSFLLLLFLIVSSKILLIGFMGTSLIDTFAGRNFIGEIPILFYVLTTEKIKPSFKIISLSICMFIGIVHLDLIMAQFYGLGDFQYLKSPSLAYGIKNFGHNFYLYLSDENFALRFSPLTNRIIETTLIYTALFSFLFLAIRKFKKYLPPILICGISLLFLITFGLDFFNNDKSKPLAKRGIVLKGEGIYLKELEDIIQIAERSNEKFGTPSEVYIKKRKKRLKKIYKSNTQEASL